MTSNIPKTKEGNSSSSNAADNDSVRATPSATTTDIPSFGWSQYAERINGRFAMIGFMAIVLIEILNRSSFLNWAGLTFLK